MTTAHGALLPDTAPRQQGALVELRRAGKSYGNVRALYGVDLAVHPGRVTCVLGDNGAGKSTLIKIVSGLHQHTEGEFLVDGEPVRFSTPREALDKGIAAVYQDLATVPLMPVWRNFFLGSELTKGPWPVRRLDIARMKRTADEELRAMGIVLDDLEQPIGTLSGGQRQCVAIARAVHFGARVLILDEPTAALGVKQSGVVLKYIAAARDRGLGVIFITHNPHHAYMVGDHFSVLRLGTLELSADRSEVSPEELTNHMAGGTELAALKHELAQVRGVDVEELPEAEDLTAPATAPDAPAASPTPPTAAPASPEGTP
ncbi:ATP-binding cassette domain-containing protein [Streptomyces chromofuscus]|uniref:Sugar ABC transporter ATP-binding protein n=1 Tax=Streptomyces chromofuscus TaxID=42881 RepID=A0A7M2T7N3_STRCW|nr:ATP-binding cassette domain-containing protein [Streptomyces chromofuscus]QOV44224.1 sugar ABC transporter ATP-binding protein [Streptomyces chromofuscus]GGT31657.1 ABC transporter ATP-binding protein [Streptomyces chromofuscus]